MPADGASQAASDAIGFFNRQEMPTYSADKGQAFQEIVRICSSGTSAVASLNLTSSHAVLHTVCRIILKFPGN